MNVFNNSSGRNAFSSQIQKDLFTSNVTVNCDPRIKGPKNSPLDIQSISGNLAVENDICDLTVSDLTVKGELFAKLKPSNLNGGKNYSDYLFYDDATECFAVGSEEVHIGANARATATNAIAIGKNANATGQFGSSAVAIGVDAEAGSASAVAIGDTAVVNASQAIAIGKNAKVSGNFGFSIAIGPGAEVANDFSLVIGQDTTTSRSNCLFLNTSGEPLNDTSGVSVAADNVLKIATLPLGSAANQGGIKQVGTNTISPNPLNPGGADSRFTHYLVYDPLSGEIQICPFA